MVNVWTAMPACTGGTPCCGAGASWDDTLSFGNYTGSQFNHYFNGVSWTAMPGNNRGYAYYCGYTTVSSSVCSLFGPANAHDYWNGSTWSSRSVIPACASYNAGCGDTEDALFWSGDYGVSYSWNGAAWSASLGNPSVPGGATAYITLKGSSSASALAFRNGSVSTARWNGAAWGASTTRISSYPAGGTGTDTDGVQAYAASACQTWSGTTWSSGSLPSVSLGTAGSGAGAASEALIVCWGSTATQHFSSQVLEAPVANFSGTPTSGLAPLTVVFTDLSTNTPTSWNWVWGDGATPGTTQNPTHIYASAGTYTVTLTATNAYGTDDEVKVAYIVVSPSVTPYDPALAVGDKVMIAINSGRPVGVKIR